jgi:hypothetical protein
MSSITLSELLTAPLGFHFHMYPVCERYGAPLGVQCEHCTSKHKGSTYGAILRVCNINTIDFNLRIFKANEKEEALFPIIDELVNMINQDCERNSRGFRVAELTIDVMRETMAIIMKSLGAVFAEYKRRERKRIEDEMDERLASIKLEPVE